ncbi:DUF599 domain-containing protein [uncultured Cocleimonas sp.]|uniref:DUF599 domain-containing protein n=1 Tax=uncultured Cocleimonas sp. TaxID=1051587 RepID=UPI00260680AC|nr:DUF599 domain-containing protein [uncultured Cocleimonas sp.]
MLETLNQIGISYLDLIALFWFVILWISYVRFTRYKFYTHKVGLLAEMNSVRMEWALELIRRDNRIMDSQVLNGLIRKETFFASTTMLILASSLALIGVGDDVLKLFHNIPFAQSTSKVLWELKVLVLIIIFMFAFFKFTWSIRQHSYCSTFLGSIPPAKESESEVSKVKAKQLADLSSLAANHFNDGLRAYYFALAELSWFFHPLVFMLATTWVVIILYRREYHSKALAILKGNKSL